MAVAPGSSVLPESAEPCLRGEGGVDSGRARRSQAERCFQEPQPPLSDKEWKKNGAGMMRVAMWQVRIELTALGL